MNFAIVLPVPFDESARERSMSRNVKNIVLEAGQARHRGPHVLEHR